MEEFLLRMKMAQDFAELVRFIYTRLIEVGFTEEQAMDLTKHQLSIAAGQRRDDNDS